MQHQTSARTKALAWARWPARVLALSLGLGLGYLGRPPSASTLPVAAQPTVAPSDSTAAERPPRLAASAAGPVTAPLDAVPATAAAPTTPLPGPGPIAPLLPDLRERARRGDIAAARRAHRDLFFCEHAQHFASGSEPRDLRVRCVAEQLCDGLRDADFTEGGRFLLRAAELGDVEAMAGVADGLAVGISFSGPNLAASLALGPQYLRRALEAAVPMALFNTYLACEPPDPFGLQPFRRSFSAEEQYAWGVAVLTIPGTRPGSLGEMRERCAQTLEPLALQRAEAHGLRLHAQFLSHVKDRAAWRHYASNLGVPSLYDAQDPRLLDWPQCATGF